MINAARLRAAYRGIARRTQARIRTRARALATAATALPGRIVHTTPHAGQWKHSYRALQEQARSALAKLEAFSAGKTPAPVTAA